MKPLITVPELLAAPSALRFDARHRLLDPPVAERLFREAHLPRARRLDLDRDLSGPKTGLNGRHPFPDREELARRFGDLGIAADAHVVLYDDADHSGAARAWALLRWLGFARAQVLDGGLKAWVAAGEPTEAGESSPSRMATLPVGPSLLELRDASTVLAGTPVVDVRAPERYRGEKEPIDPVAGHIPGARNLPYLGLLGPDGRFLPPAELAEKLPREKSVFYCGSGVTSCVALLAAAVVEREAALYPGSWSEWCAQPGAKIATGEEP